MAGLDQIVWWLVVLGAINWGLAAINFNIVELVLGAWPQATQIVYILIGLAGVYYLFNSLGGKKRK